MRPGSAGANAAADPIAVLDLALAQLPAEVRGRVLVRTDSGGGTKTFLAHLTERRLAYSVGIGVNIGVDRDLLRMLDPQVWTDAYDSDGQPRDGAQVAELTGMLPQLAGRGWAAEHAGHRPPRTAPPRRATATDRRRRLAHHRVRDQRRRRAAGRPRPTHRRRARCEDRIRVLKDTGLRNLPLHDFTQNQVWVETVLLAADLLVHTATLGLTRHRTAEPKRLRLRIFAVAARIIRTGRRTLLRLPADWPWAGEIAAAHARLRALPAPH